MAPANDIPKRPAGTNSKLSKQEKKVRQFQKYDTDQDGLLSLEEYSVRVADRNRENNSSRAPEVLAARYFKNNDDNKDGFISFEELFPAN